MGGAEETRRAAGAAIFLVGMMGSGKSSVGPLLAERLGRSFVDADRLVEQIAGRRIAEIFAQDGEAAFRKLERDAIDQAGAGGAVVALGGGAIAQPGAAERLAELGQVVYLRAGIDALLERVGEARDRPLLAGLDAAGRRARLAELLAEREAAYLRATVVVDTDDRSPSEVAARVEEQLAGTAATESTESS